MKRTSNHHSLILRSQIEGVEVSRGGVAIFWLGQNSYIFKTSRETLIGLDLYLSRKLVPLETYIYPEPPIKPEEVPVDYVFCTHDHEDHTDPNTLPPISKHSPQTRFLGPEESYAHILKMGIPKDRAERLEENATCWFDDFAVTPYYSVPPDDDSLPPKDRTTHYGYIFNFEGLKVYNMGDSSPSMVDKAEELLEPIVKTHPEIAMFPIIGDYPTRKPEDAAKFTRIVKPRIVIPMHYGCFKDRTIDPTQFTRLIADKPEIKPVIIEYGGYYIAKKQ